MAAKRDPKEKPLRVSNKPLKPIGDVKTWIDELRREGVIGMWADRDDIGNSAEFARKLREEAQHRPHLHET